MAIEIVGLDADDTLWHSEGQFHVSEQRFRELMAPWVDDEELLSSTLLQTERRNLELFGYGAKGFTLSMIETALALTDHRVDGRRIEQIIGFGKEILAHPVELIEGVLETVAGLAERYRLVLVTKGDLFHQESKIAASGLGDLFDQVDVVSEKDAATYARTLLRIGGSADRFCMVGNSLKSDVLPAVELGAYGIHVPYHLTWALEHAEADEHPHWRTAASIAEVPGIIEEWGG
ncbi:MAG: HAD hydrolase-like protein [Thermoleophilia bacterium]|nr:HAD hydrolase-like protein [Thermoleophilia bacterium]